MLRKALPSLCGLVVLLLVSAAPAHATLTPDGFIKQVGDKAFQQLSPSNLTDQQRLDRFQNLLNESFDLKYIGRFVLGIYWRRATDKQKTEFLDLFEKFIVQAYANRFRDLSDKKFVVKESRSLGDRDSLVLSQVNVPGEQPIKVNWKVRDEKGGFKIIDVTVGGISMSVTQRDEFTAVINQNGGRVQGLIDALRRKVSQ